MAGPEQADAEQAERPTQGVVCSACGATAAGPAPLTWSSATGPRGLRLVCDRCTRENLRSIEGKLDEAWW